MSLLPWCIWRRPWSCRAKNGVVSCFDRVSNKFCVRNGSRAVRFCVCCLSLSLIPPFSLSSLSSSSSLLLLPSCVSLVDFRVSYAALMNSISVLCCPYVVVPFECVNTLPEFVSRMLITFPRVHCTRGIVMLRIIRPPCLQFPVV